MSIGKYTRSFIRFIKICLILARQILINLPYRLVFVPRPKSIKVISKYLKTRRPKISVPLIARETLEKLGPTYVKFGQFLSIRPDLIPPEFCAEFRKLQDKVPPFSFAHVKRELEKELKCDYTDVFSEFDEIAVAAASVAQVHRGRLRSGEEVAVKIQRPGIREEMEEDILIMLFFAILLEKLVPSLRKNQPVMLIHEFSRWTDRELDFCQEGKNALHFSYYFKDYPGVKIPNVFLDHTTERMLVMEFIHGTNTLEAPPESIDRKAVAHLIAESMLKQIFVDGFFHGDPHAGNIFLMEKNTIAYLDFGIVGYLSEDLRAWTFDILYGMSEGNIERVIESFMELCNVSEEDVDIQVYRRHMNEVLSELHICEMACIPFTHMMERFLNTSLEYRIVIPHDFVMMSKAIATLEGTCLSLNPEIRIVEYLKPFVQKYMMTVPEWDDVIKQLKSGPFELGKLKRLITKHGIRALHVLERPTFRIEGGEFRNIVREMEKSSVNVAYGLLIAALIVFSASLSNESSFEAWLKSKFNLPVMPLLSIVSLAVAGYLWLRLYLRNRIKKGRNDRLRKEGR
jgi:ubiquinone biosynthesis protein